MVGIGGHAADAEEDQALQAADVLLGVPEICHIVVVVVAAGVPADGAVRHQPGLFGMDPVQKRLDGVVFEVDIGDAGEEGLLNERIRFGGQQVGISVRSPGQADQGPGQFILQ